LYACDEKWWRHHWEDIKATFRGKLYTQYHNDATKKWADEFGITAIKGVGGSGLDTKHIKHGSNSGHQAICLAVLLGATRIYLLGYDMGATGQTHWFGAHPKGLHMGNMKGFVPQFDNLARDLKASGIECINLTRETALTQFKRASIDDWDIHSV